MAPPLVGADGTIYVGSDDAKMYAVNPDGTLQWDYLTDGPIWSGATIANDGTLYVGTQGSYLYALFTSSLGLYESSWPKFRKDQFNTACIQSAPAVPIQSNANGLILILFSIIAGITIYLSKKESWV
jgi:outer membrane protein assembly factor BamB